MMANVSVQPDFLIIGAQKCSTSWLHHHLRRHSGIYMPDDKDVEFFSYAGNLNESAFEQWCERFRGAGDTVRIGDANAAYFWTETGSRWAAKPASFNPVIPASIRQFLGPNLGCIALLRDPVERAVSAYLHHIAHRAITPETAIGEVRAPLGIVDMGFYGRHLQNWLEHYPPANLLVLDTADPDFLLRRCCEFLGVPYDDLDPVAIARPVFPGIPRIMRDDGVWVPLHEPRLSGHFPLQRPAPITEIDGEKHVRLIHSSELAWLRNIYTEDQALLAELRKQG